jgi:hypothetical protein
MANPSPIQPLLPDTYSLHHVLITAQTLMTWYGNAPMPNFIEVQFLGPDVNTADAAQGHVIDGAEPETDATLWGVINALQLSISKYGFLVPMPTFKKIDFKFPDGPTSEFQYFWENTGAVS